VISPQSLRRPLVPPASTDANPTRAFLHAVDHHFCAPSFCFCRTGRHPLVDAVGSGRTKTDLARILASTRGCGVVLLRAERVYSSSHGVNIEKRSIPWRGRCGARAGVRWGHWPPDRTCAVGRNSLALRVSRHIGTHNSSEFPSPREALLSSRCAGDVLHAGNPIHRSRPSILDQSYPLRIDSLDFGAVMAAG